MIENDPKLKVCPVHRAKVVSAEINFREKQPLSLVHNNNNNITPLISRQLKQPDLDEVATVTLSIPKARNTTSRTCGKKTKKFSTVRNEPSVTKRQPVESRRKIRLVGRGGGK